jgi:hypothetical protein
VLRPICPNSSPSALNEGLGERHNFVASDEEPVHGPFRDGEAKRQAPAGWEPMGLR